MKKITFILLLHVGLMNILTAQNCATFNQDANGKPLKIIVYTKLDLCFQVSKESALVNVNPSKRVTFFTDYDETIISLKSGDSINIDKKIFVGNRNMASDVYELIYKKGKYELKNKLFEASTTQESKNQFDDQVKQQDEDRKKSDEDWNNKLAEKKKEKEQQKANEEKEQQRANEEKEAREKIALQKKAEKEEKEKVEQKSQPITSSNNQTEQKKEGLNISVTETKTGYPFNFLIMYQNKPIKNQKFVIVSDDKNKKELMSGTTNNEGLVTMYHQLDYGKYDIELYIDFKGTKSKPTSYSITIGNTSNRVFIVDYDKLISNMMEQTKNSRNHYEKFYSLDKVNY